MHTTRFQVEGLKGEVVGEVVVNHNADWSGEAIVTFEDPSGRKSTYPDPVVGGWIELRLPGPLLVALGRQAATAHLKDEIVRFVENL